MSCKEIDDFLRLLNVSPSGAVFNPWWEVDEQNDVGHNAPAIRRNQLRAYLEERLGKSKVAIIGEALGNVAVSQLKEMNVECQGVRHPASGGAKLFREQIGRILQKLRP